MDFDEAVAELDALVQALEREGDERGLLALQLVDAIHRPALERIAAGDLEHPVARALLAMYDLAPWDELDASLGEIVSPEPERGTPLPQAARLRRPVFVEVEPLDLSPGRLRAVVVDGVPVLLANVEGELYALKNACVADGRPLEEGRLDGAVLVCPWHNCAYDARSGKRVDDVAEPGLAVVPIAVEDGAVRVAVNVA